MKIEIEVKGEVNADTLRSIKKTLDNENIRHKFYITRSGVQGVKRYSTAILYLPKRIIRLRARSSYIINTEEDL
jgi:hypothetical protein